MTEEEALWYEFGHVDSQQGSSSEGNLWVDMPSARALSQGGARPSGQNTKEVDSDNLEVVYSEGTPGDAKIEILESNLMPSRIPVRVCFSRILGQV